MPPRKPTLRRAKLKALALLLISLPSASPAADSPRTLRVYAYESFAAKDGLGALVAKSLEADSIKTEFVTFASAGEAVNQLAIEGASTRADLIVGVDEGLLARARKLGLFESQRELSEELKLPQDLLYDAELKFLPFDYGYVALVYDSARVKKTPTSLKNFAADPEYRKRLVLPDPRTSSIGLSFLLWTKALAGDDWEGMWKGLAGQVLTVAPGWSAAYGLFLKKEADFVVSYTTSPAYHFARDKAATIRAVSFPEGHYRQIEGVGIVSGKGKRELAKTWVRALLDKKIQASVPTTQWMYPVRSLPLPESFAKIPQVKPIAPIDPSVIESSKKEWLRRWTSWMAKTK